MPWHLRAARSQTKQPLQPLPQEAAGEVSAGERDGPCPHMGFDSQSPTWHSHPAALMPSVARCHGGGWDRRLAYQIFICLLCGVQILWSGKMHYVWISAGAASDKSNRTLWIGRHICFVFGLRHAAGLRYDESSTGNNSDAADVKLCIIYANHNIIEISLSHPNRIKR